MSRYPRGEWHSPSHDRDKFPYCQTMAFDIHVTDEFVCILNGYFLAMVNGIKNDE